MKKQKVGIFHNGTHKWMECCDRVMALEIELKQLRADLASEREVSGQHCADAVNWRRLWEAAKNSCADHARRADELAKQNEVLKAEIASHHEETQQVCGYKKLIDMEAKLAAQAGLLEKAVEDIRYIAEQCESVGRVEGIDIAESRTWKVVGRLARESLALIQAGKEK